MPNSRTEQVLAAIAAAVNGSGKPAGTKGVDRGRIQPLDLQSLPRITVYFDDEDVELARPSRTVEVADRTMRVAVVSRIAGREEDIDPYRVWVPKALKEDENLRSLIISVIEKRSSGQGDEGAENDYNVLTQIFSVRYTTNTGDLTRKS